MPEGELAAEGAPSSSDILNQVDAHPPGSECHYCSVRLLQPVHLPAWGRAQTTIRCTPPEIGRGAGAAAAKTGQTFFPSILILISMYTAVFLL